MNMLSAQLTNELTSLTVIMIMFNCSIRAVKLITVRHKQMSLLYLNRMRSLSISELCQLYVCKYAGIHALFVRVNSPFEARRLLFIHPIF